MHRDRTGDPPCRDVLPERLLEYAEEEVLAVRVDPVREQRDRRHRGEVAVPEDQVERSRARRGAAHCRRPPRRPLDAHPAYRPARVREPRQQDRSRQRDDGDQEEHPALDQTRA